MKKILFVILAAVLVAGAFAACAGGGTQNEARTQDLKAIIDTAGENSLLVRPLEGLEDIDVIYLNFNDETVFNVSEGAPLEPGTIVYAVIGVEIMESYPPQVRLYEITKTEIDPDITLQPADNGDIQLAPDDYLTGKVTDIFGNKYTIEVSGSNVYQGEVIITIPDEVLDADMPIEEGYLIGVYFVPGSDPLSAAKIVFSEPDQIIELDDRETVSGYLGGGFPQAVYYMSDEHINAQAGVMFAIGLEENCESSWTLVEQEGVALAANGAGPTQDDGCYINYFGIIIDHPGDYTLEFLHEAADGNFDFSFNVTVE